MSIWTCAKVTSKAEQSDAKVGHGRLGAWVERASSKSRVYARHAERRAHAGTLYIDERRHNCHDSLGGKRLNERQL